MLFFFFRAEDGIRATSVTGVQTCALPISVPPWVAISPNARPTAAQASRTVLGGTASRGLLPTRQIGRASCRERAEMSEVRLSFKKNTINTCNRHRQEY